MSGLFLTVLNTADPHQKTRRIIGVVCLITLASWLPLISTQLTAQAQYGANEYGTYFDQGSNYFSQGEISKAIDAFKKAAPLADESSIPTVYNNLAAAYIKRGQYFQDKERQYDGALSDYRNALFYLEYAWPDGVAKRPIHERNLNVLLQNINSVYQSLNLKPSNKEVHLEKGRQLRLKSMPEAVVEFGQALKIDPKNAEAAKALGDIFNVINMPFKSAKYYQIAGSSLGNNASDALYVQQATAAYKTGDIDQAVKFYNKAIEVNPNNTDALNKLKDIWLNEIKFNNASVLGHANLGSVYQKLKLYDDAFTQYNAADHFAEMNRATPFEVKKLIRLNIGTLFQEKKQYQLANAAYDTVLQSEPNNVLALTYKASLLKEVGKPDEAAGLYQKILVQEPNNALAQQALFGLATQQSTPQKVETALKDYGDRFSGNADIQAKVGEEFHRLKNYDNALMYYQRAIRLNPSLASALANMGAVYQSQGKEAESVQAYQQALKLDPSNTTVKTLLLEAEQSVGLTSFKTAVDLQQAGNHQEAISYFQQALLKTPDNADLIAAYGISLQNVGKLDEAIRQYQRAISLNASNANFHYYLATVYHQKNQAPLAIASYKRALQLDPQLADAKTGLNGLEQQESNTALTKAIDAYNAKRYPQALLAVNEAIAKDRNNPLSYYYKGLILTAQKNNPAATAAYRDAIRLNPEFSDAYYSLAITLDAQKDQIAAKNAFQRFVELSAGKDDELVRYAQERLKSL